MNDRGGWIQTSHGRQFWPMDPRADEVFIDDIAHALSMLCRYGGHSLRFYSVAEHSVLLSRSAAPENKLWALLHDATEAYLVDVPRPIKPFLVGYKEAEIKIMRAICERFDMAIDMPTKVKEADTRILFDERAQNMMKSSLRWEFEAEPLGVLLQCWTPAVARANFLSDFHYLISRSAP